MQKLSEAIKLEAYNEPTTEELSRTELDKAGETWAVHCLRTYTGKLLNRGLVISASISNFTNELVNPAEED
jgi:hypothetical protein